MKEFKTNFREKSEIEIISSEGKKHIAVLAPDVLNSDPPAMEKQQSHNQIMHLMGEHSPFRVKVFGTAFRNLCKHIKDPYGELPHQLGVTQPNLLKWTIEEYKAEMMDLLAVYEPPGRTIPNVKPIGIEQVNAWGVL